MISGSFAPRNGGLPKSRSDLESAMTMDVSSVDSLSSADDYGFAIALALATNRLAQVLVTCHWSQVTVFELGLLTTGRAGDPRGKPTVQFGVNLVNGGRIAGTPRPCHEQNLRRTPSLPT
jgi:hypothetical protein